MNFFAASFVVDMRRVMMCSFCLLSSMKLIVMPNCSLLCLHSNDVDHLKSLLLKKTIIAINIIVIINHKASQAFN